MCHALLYTYPICKQLPQQFGILYHFDQLDSHRSHGTLSSSTILCDCSITQQVLQVHHKHMDHPVSSVNTHSSLTYIDPSNKLSPKWYCLSITVPFWSIGHSCDTVTCWMWLTKWLSLRKMPITHDTRWIFNKVIRAVTNSHITPHTQLQSEQN